MRPASSGALTGDSSWVRSPPVPVLGSRAGACTGPFGATVAAGRAAVAAGVAGRAVVAAGGGGGGGGAGAVVAARVADGAAGGGGGAGGAPAGAGGGGGGGGGGGAPWASATLVTVSESAPASSRAWRRILTPIHSFPARPTPGPTVLSFPASQTAKPVRPLGTLCILPAHCVMRNRTARSL
jgi:hypothetical protein